MGKETSTLLPNPRRFWGWGAGLYNRIGFPALRSLWFVVAFLVWSWVFVAIIDDVYEPHNVWIGPNSSILVDPNPFFVQSVKVEELDDSKPGLVLFGFYKSPPPLDVIVNWSEPRLLSLSPSSFKGWPYYLNNGASLNISYSVKSEGSSALLVVEKGGLKHCSRPSLSEEPPYLDTSLAWKLIRGSGVIELKITEASTYCVSVSNLNMEEVKVELDVGVRAILYDTKQSSYKCNLSNDDCTYNAVSLFEKKIVLTSPAIIPGASVEGWYIRFSYQPRWTRYLIAEGLLMCYLLVVLQFWKMVQRYLTEDGDGSSMDSSYQALAVLEEIPGNGGSLCDICFQCGTKVAKANENCPICRREIKKMKMETCILNV